MNRRLITIFMRSLLLSLLIIILASVICFWFTSSKITDLSVTTAKDTMESTVEMISDFLEEQMENGLSVATSSDVTEFVGSDDAITRLDLRDTVRTLLNHYVSFTTGAESSYLFLADGGYISTDDKQTDLFLFAEALLEEYDLRGSFRSQIITTNYTIGDSQYFAVLTPVFQTSQSSGTNIYKGAIVLIYQAKLFENYFATRDNPYCFIENTNTLLAAGDENVWSAVNSGAETEILTQEIDGTDWSYVLLINEFLDLSEISRLKMICIIICCAALGALSLLTIIQYREIVHPIMKIAEDTKKIQYGTDQLEGKYDLLELNQMTENINDMLRRTNKLNEQMKVIEHQYYEGQISFLQAQVNPHFLFNTFECIRGMASDGQMEAVRSITSYMARFYRYCCSDPWLVPMYMEIDSLLQYEQIMKLRYGDIYHLQLNFDQSLRQIEIPRVSLQPLVENAILHGLIPSRKVGIVRLEASSIEGLIHIVIEDSGVGMAESELKHYNELDIAHQDSFTGHIGIENVMKRYSLCFGEDCRFEFTNSSLGGLKIDISFHYHDLPGKMTFGSQDIGRSSSS